MGGRGMKRKVWLKVSSNRTKHGFIRRIRYEAPRELSTTIASNRTKVFYTSAQYLTLVPSSQHAFRTNLACWVAARPSWGALPALLLAYLTASSQNDSPSSSSSPSSSMKRVLACALQMLPLFVLGAQEDDSEPWLDQTDDVSGEGWDVRHSIIT